jgi:hypothetical protein
MSWDFLRRGARGHCEAFALLGEVLSNGTRTRDRETSDANNERRTAGWDKQRTHVLYKSKGSGHRRSAEAPPPFARRSTWEIITCLPYRLSRLCLCLWGVSLHGRFKVQRQTHPLKTKPPKKNGPAVGNAGCCCIAADVGYRCVLSIAALPLFTFHGRRALSVRVSVRWRC